MSRSIIVPSASAVVLFGTYALVSLVHACDPDVGKQRHASGSVASGGIIQDYDPAKAEPSSQAVKAAGREGTR